MAQLNVKNFSRHGIITLKDQIRETSELMKKLGIELLREIAPNATFQLGEYDVYYMGHSGLSFEDAIEEFSGDKSWLISFDINNKTDYVILLPVVSYETENQLSVYDEEPMVISWNDLMNIIKK